MNGGTAPPTVSGLVTEPSAHSAGQTIARLEDAVRRRGLTIFARIDHRANAHDAGLQMPAAYVLIFGNAAAGTPLMLAAPLAAFDLPLRVLVWEDVDGGVWASYNSPSALAGRYGFPASLASNIDGIAAVVAAAIGP
jgi:uncharacterized protein (DUF302 family)